MKIINNFGVNITYQVYSSGSGATVATGELQNTGTVSPDLGTSKPPYGVSIQNYGAPQNSFLTTNNNLTGKETIEVTLLK